MPSPTPASVPLLACELDAFEKRQVQPTDRPRLLDLARRLMLETALTREALRALLDAHDFATTEAGRTEMMAGAATEGRKILRRSMEVERLATWWGGLRFLGATAPRPSEAQADPDTYAVWYAAFAAIWRSAPPPFGDE